MGGRRKQSLALNSELVFVIVLNISFLLGLLGLKFYLKRRAERNMKAYLRYLRNKRKYNVRI